mmetsp:Transcript_6720/g.17148  ORF Transcript_6720/g.17148 Transcript_6720/m.17148 type:complete len:602 (+) Transcript_6720:103-1908(+)
MAAPTSSKRLKTSGDGLCGHEYPRTVAHAEREAPPSLRHMMQVNDALLEKAEEALSSELLGEYEQLETTYLAAGNRKADMTASSEMSRAGRVRAIRHGRVPGVHPGQKFRNKGALLVLGIHDCVAQGISKPRKDTKAFSKGAYAIALSGGYKDDDQGDVITYTGVGTSGDQSFTTPGNGALRNNCLMNEPVRVVRKSQATKHEKFCYIYDGLYDVIHYALTREGGDTGRLVAKFTMKRSESNTQAPSTSMPYDPKILTGFHRATAKKAAGKKTTRCKGVVMAGDCILHPKPKGPDVSPSPAMPPSKTAPERLANSSRICADISNGVEALPIPVYNEVDDETVPDFEYINHLELTDSSVRSLVYAAAASPDKFYLPFGDGHIAAEDAYLRAGPGTPASSTTMLTEKAINEIGAEPELQVVSRGTMLPLEVFKTKERGWGVRCSAAISAGAFICDYAGEVISSGAAEARSSAASAYLFDLDHFSLIFEKRVQQQEELMGCRLDPNTRHIIEQRCKAATAETLAVDALRSGGVARFINNSDDHYNCAVQPVYTARNHSTVLFRLAIFAVKDIPPRTELTYCYGYNAYSEDDTTLPEWYVRSRHT